MKTNGTRRIVTFMLALVLVFTTVCVGTTEVEAAEKFTTIVAPTQTEQATAGTEVKTPFSLTKSYGFVAQIVTEAPVRRNAEPAKNAALLIWTLTVIPLSPENVSAATPARESARRRISGSRFRRRKMRAFFKQALEKDGRKLLENKRK